MTHTNLIFLNDPKTIDEIYQGNEETKKKLYEHQKNIENTIFHKLKIRDLSEKSIQKYFWDGYKTPWESKKQSESSFNPSLLNIIIPLTSSQFYIRAAGIAKNEHRKILLTYPTQFEDNKIHPYKIIARNLSDLRWQNIFMLNNQVNSIEIDNIKDPFNGIEEIIKTGFSSRATPFNHEYYPENIVFDSNMQYLKKNEKRL